MNTYVPVRRIIRIVSMQRNPKHERRSSLQECSYSAWSRRRCRWKPWLILFILLSVIFLYCHRPHYQPAMNGQVFINEVHYEAPPHEKIKSTDHVTHKTKTTASPKRVTADNTKTKATVNFYKTYYDVLNISRRANQVAVQLQKSSGLNLSEDLRSPEFPSMGYLNSLLLLQTYLVGSGIGDSITLESGPNLRPTEHSALDLPLCFRKRPYLKFQIKMKSVDLSQENVYPLVVKGGSYHPPDCKVRFKVGIIVPYRDRKRNLGIFLYNIHPFLMRQKLDYQIFVIEQNGTGLFNKGRVYNAGYTEMLKFNVFHCVVFHDVDLLPLHENIVYSCPTLPRHMCARVNDTQMKKLDPSYQFQSLFGGVVSMTREQFERANGFSNLYFGWGAEDDDMFRRLRLAGYPIMRYNSTVGVYLVLPHKREKANPFRYNLLGRAMERYKIDGLRNSEYYVISTKFRPLFTHIVVDINPRRKNITYRNHKWDSNGYKFY